MNQGSGRLCRPKPGGTALMTGGNLIYDSPDDKVANLPDLINPANG